MQHGTLTHRAVLASAMVLTSLLMTACGPSLFPLPSNPPTAAPAPSSAPSAPPTSAPPSLPPTSTGGNGQSLETEATFVYMTYLAVSGVMFQAGVASPEAYIEIASEAVAIETAALIDHMVTAGQTATDDVTLLAFRLTESDPSGGWAEADACIDRSTQQFFNADGSLMAPEEPAVLAVGLRFWRDPETGVLLLDDIGDSSVQDGPDWACAGQ